MAKITVGELIKELELFSNKNAEVNFSGLDFYRTKYRGEDEVQIEFNQTITILNDDEAEAIE